MVDFNNCMQLYQQSFFQTFDRKISLKLLIVFPSSYKGMEKFSVAAVSYITTKCGADLRVSVFQLKICK